MLSGRAEQRGKLQVKRRERNIDQADNGMPKRPSVLGWRRHGTQVGERVGDIRSQ